MTKLTLTEDVSRNAQRREGDDDQIWFGILTSADGRKVAVACAVDPVLSEDFLSAAGSGAVVEGSRTYHAQLETLIHRTPVGGAIDTDILDEDDASDLIACLR